MKRALDLARAAADEGEVPVGAVIVRGESVIAEAANRTERDHDPTAHAEILALRQATQVLGYERLDGCTVYVSKEPCPMCAGAMVLARVERCVYAVADPKSGAAGSVLNVLQVPGLNHQVLITSGILAREAAQILKTFFARLRERS